MLEQMGKKWKLKEVLSAHNQVSIIGFNSIHTPIQFQSYPYNHKTKNHHSEDAVFTNVFCAC